MSLREVDEIGERYRKYIDELNLNDTDNFTKLFTSVLALRDVYEQQHALIFRLQSEVHSLRDRAEEAERNLKQHCACTFTSGGNVKKSCEHHQRLIAAARREGMEEVLAAMESKVGSLRLSQRQAFQDRRDVIGNLLCGKADSLEHVIQHVRAKMKEQK